MKYNKSIHVSFKKECYLHEKKLYVEKKTEDNYDVINTELARYFSNNNHHVARGIRLEESSPFFSGRFIYKAKSKHILYSVILL